jgi:lipopolysaccharide transport system permease protein
MIGISKNRPETFQLRIGYYLDAIGVLIGRELAIRYKGSVLGLLWAVLSPLATVAILYFLFTHILPLGIPHYSSFVYSGLLSWTWFSAAVHTGSSTLLDNRDLVRKPFFARPLLPVVVVGTNFLLYLLALPVLLILLMIDGLAPTSALLLLPLVWGVQALFTLACTMLMAALSVVVRDMQHLLGIILLMWFYLTPIFYNLGQLPAEKARLFVLNPMAVIVQSHRAITVAGLPPDWPALAGVVAISSLLLIFSYIVFRSLEDTFVERL